VRVTAVLLSYPPMRWVQPAMCVTAVPSSEVLKMSIASCSPHRLYRWKIDSMTDLSTSKYIPRRVYLYFILQEYLKLIYIGQSKEPASRYYQWHRTLPLFDPVLPPPELYVAASFRTDLAGMASYYETRLMHEARTEGWTVLSRPGGSSRPTTTMRPWNPPTTEFRALVPVGNWEQILDSMFPDYIFHVNRHSS
jgi:hypothetical protein